MKRKTNLLALLLCSFLTFNSMPVFAQEFEEVEENTEIEEVQSQEEISEPEKNEETLVVTENQETINNTQENNDNAILNISYSVSTDSEFEIEEDVIDGVSFDGPSTINKNNKLTFNVTAPSGYVIEKITINNEIINTKSEDNTVVYCENIDVSTFDYLDVVAYIEPELETVSFKLDENLLDAKLDDAIIRESKLFSDFSGGPINIDGHYGDWSDKPLTWHYNWDNSSNCWYYGEWSDGNCYKSPEGEYNNDVRHLIQLYTDNEYVYVHIKIATIYNSCFNGEDYRLTFNGKQTRFQITDQNGNTLTNAANNLAPGTYDVQVRHGDGSCSYQIAEGASATLTIYDNHKNSDLEFKIPISTCKQQNPSIDTDNIESITFFTPNLMYKCIETHGTPTYPGVLLVICLAIALSAEFIYTKKGKKIK